MRAADLRVAALAAFSHEIRTPLTALRMITDLATPAENGGKMLDAELVEMLGSSLDELNNLADALQEQSRAERGLVSPANGRTTLGEILDFALAAAAEQAVTLVPAGTIPDTDGPWDRHRLGGALASLVIGLDRLATHSGQVRCEAGPGSPGLVFSSSGSGEERPDPLRPAPFAFFVGIAELEAAGWTVDLELDDECRCTVSLPLHGASD